MHFTKLILAAILSYSTTIIADPLSTNSAIAAPNSHSTLSTGTPLDARQVGKARKALKRKGLKAAAAKAAKVAKAVKSRRLTKRDDEETDEVVAKEFDFLDEDASVTQEFDLLDEGEGEVAKVAQPALERRQGKKGRRRGRKNRKAAKGAGKGAAKGKGKARRAA